MLAAALTWPTTGHAAPAGPVAAPTAAPTAAAPAASAPATSESAPSTATAPSTAAGPDMDEVKRIYASGKVKYETKNYAGAIDDWTAALGMLPETPENREIRNDLVYNIATAQEKAYDIDRDVVHLRTARALLVDFLEAYKAMYRPDEQTVAEFKRVNERIALLDTKIAEAEKAGPAPAKKAEKRRLDLEVKQVLQTDPVLAKQYKSGRGMVIGGSITLGIGGLLLLVAAGVSSQNDDSSASLSRAEKRTNRDLAVALAVVGLAAAAGGATLLGIGIPKRRKAREAAVSRVVFAPTFGPSPGGGRFVGFGAIARF